jgi:hypothetical protein
MARQAAQYAGEDSRVHHRINESREVVLSYPMWSASGRVAPAKALNAPAL